MRNDISENARHLYNAKEYTPPISIKAFVGLLMWNNSPPRSPLLLPSEELLKFVQLEPMSLFI